MVELVGGKTDLRRVGSRWVGPVPVPRRAHAVVLRQRRRQALLLLRLRGQGRRHRLRAADRGARLPRVGRAAGRALRHRARAGGRGSGRGAATPAREERLLGLLDRTARFYATFLWDAAEAGKAREYLAGRGLSEEMLRAFRVGYAPSAWDRLTVSAQRDGFTPEELVAAGVAQRGRGGGFYDRFRGRIMFPLADARGKVLGFGARSMGEGRGPEVPEHLGERDLPQGPPALRDRPGPRARRQGGSDRGRGGLHGRAGAAPGGHRARPWPSWARRSPRSSWPSSGARLRGCCSRSTRTARGRRRCCRAARSAGDRGRGAAGGRDARGRGSRRAARGRGSGGIRGPRRARTFRARVSGGSCTCRCRSRYSSGQGPSARGGQTAHRSDA